MVKDATIKYVEAIDTGEMDLAALRENFSHLGDVINEHADEMRALSSKQTQSVNYAVDQSGLKTILEGGKHLRIEIVNAFVQMGDNITNENIVELMGISDPIRFSPTEKAGKVRIFDIHKKNLMFSEGIIVKTSSNRRVIISVLFKSTEVGN
ncbi:hypothetical protein KA005_65215 [bacterium]|nr:hypothetical protein [bacterium]